MRVRLIPTLLGAVFLPLNVTAAVAQLAVIANDAKFELVKASLR